MSFTGGRVPFLGITPSYLVSLATQTASNGVSQALGQVWQGAGQSFYGQAGQALGGALAGSAVNIALNSVFGTNVVGPQGLTLDSGANLLASTITPYVTSTIAAGLNQNIQQALQTAGPFGQMLSDLGTSLVNDVFDNVSDNILGATNSATNYKMFPGGGDEPPADYGGTAYTLSEVVFSIQPANQGPQTFGLDQGINFPKSITTQPFGQLSKMPLLAGNETANTLKQSAMVGGLSQKAFSPSFKPSSFNTTTSFL